MELWTKKYNYAVWADTCTSIERRKWKSVWVYTKTNSSFLEERGKVSRCWKLSAQQYNVQVQLNSRTSPHIFPCIASFHVPVSSNIVWVING